MRSNELDISLRLNGQVITAHAPARMHAADFLRHRLGLTGTHVGCEQGVCGMCTILLNGEAIKSCLLLAAQLDGAEVQTVESLAEGDRLNPLQAAFKRHHALQCGFCTPVFDASDEPQGRWTQTLPRRNPDRGQWRAVPLHRL